MPVHYEYISQSIVHCIAAGTYTYEETYRNYENALNDERSKGGVNVLMDVSRSDETRTSDELNNIVLLFLGAPSFKGKCAVLVDENSLIHYGLARMFSTYAELKNMEFMVFTKMEEALSWLQETKKGKDAT